MMIVIYVHATLNVYHIHGKRQASNDNIDNIIEINAYMQQYS